MNQMEGYVEKRRRGKKRLLVMFFLAIVLFFSGRVLFTEVWDFLGGRQYAALPDGEEHSDKLVPGEIPLYLQKDIRWRQVRYGSDNMGATGCGPTCLSMVACGLREDIVCRKVSHRRQSTR